MNEENKTSVFYSNRTIVWGFVCVVLVAILLLILPLYMQNRMTRLYTKSHDLSKQVGLLQRELLLQQLEINKLSSLESLSVFAESSGLDLNGLPTKVRVEGGHW
ncbi:hypothetical protein [uncultured Fibrobacter sp.]|uniref:hypothetical protein n=1 Tax=uncultured Fibrobacter sp. TaxID=261512 RepID=UPI002601A14D|nr:hypothetical protein [uncultured Fibrobacter sp.]